MKNVINRFVYIICIGTITLFNMLPLQAVALAVDDEEMKVLRMYFKEDTLVISPTRTLKRLSRAAENMEVITSEEIEKMNARTLAEVLERVTGMFLSFYGHDFGSDSTINIQGSNNKHVLVLLDGIIWNTLNEGNVITNTIPVRIIRRIEIIKGPASSAWGSSLGGVINIVTKEADKNRTAGGSVSASYGERGTSDLSAEVSADSGSVRYYLYAGKQDSDGLRNERWFNNETFYSKVNVPISSDIDLMFTAGYSEPHINDGDNISMDLSSNSITRDRFTTASLTAELSDALIFDASVYFFQFRFVQEVDEPAGLWTGTPGAMFKDTTIDEKTNGFTGKLVFRGDSHTAVLGTDYSYGTADVSVHAGAAQILYYSAPEMTVTSKGITKWAVFLNDTISIGKLSVTPGIRYDDNNVTGSFTSPSIGATYRAARNTILRASIAKGFNSPALSVTTSGGLFIDPNPDLISEKVWSYQAGLESWAVEYIKVKLNVFHHEIENDIVVSKFFGPAPTLNDKYFNLGRSKRDGVEIDLETAPFHDFSFRTGYAFVHKRTYYVSDTSEDTYMINAAFIYDDLRSFFGQLEGHYIWWDLDSADMPEYDTFIWDLNMSRKLYSSKKINNELFFAVHNIFNGSQYVYFEKKNPGRWIEAGVRLTF